MKRQPAATHHKTQAAREVQYFGSKGAAISIVRPEASSSSNPREEAAGKSAFEIVTARIIVELEKGRIPWRKPWKDSGLPINLVSKRRYRGINVILLNSTGHSTPCWLTQRQVNDLGGRIRPGEEPSSIVFWKWLQVTKVDPKTGKKRDIHLPLTRLYDVYNADQVEEISRHVPQEKPRLFNSIRLAEEILAGMPKCPAIQHRGDRAQYSPGLDQVVLPPMTQFDSETDYYSVAFHELIHSTGHASRLQRFEAEALAPFGSTDYSKEELVAEIGASFLCAEEGIDTATVPNSVAYIQDWLSVLWNDKRMVVLAAGQAQKAADFVLNRISDGGGKS